MITDLTNWISLSEAAARLPCPRAGKRTQSKTVLRMARKHGIRMCRRGPYRFVYWPDLVELMQPVAVVARPERRPRRILADEERTRAACRRLGI